MVTTSCLDYLFQKISSLNFHPRSITCLKLIWIFINQLLDFCGCGKLITNFVLKNYLAWRILKAPNIKTEILTNLKIILNT